jgi:DNA-binding IclR family transcriptional regulator
VGYATSYEETYPGMASVAAPVIAAARRAVAALSIAAFSSTMTDDRVRRFAGLVRGAARRMAEELRRRSPLRVGSGERPVAPGGG